MTEQKQQTGTTTRKRKRLSTLPSAQSTDGAAAAEASDSKDSSSRKSDADSTVVRSRRHRKTLTAEDKKALDEAFAELHKDEIENAKPAKRRKTGGFQLIEHGIWQGWQDIFFVGTEWNNYDLIFKQARWDFDHLEQSLFEGDLKDKKVFLFGSTEPQTIGHNQDVYLIPTITAVVGDIEPPKKLGIKSVQMEKEEFVTLDDMKMTWTPLVPKAGRDITSEYCMPGDKVKRPRIQVLHCNLRRQQLKLMKEEDVRKYEYCLPYFIRPSDMLNKDQYHSEVIGSVTIEGRGVSFEFDWEMDDLDDYVEELCKDQEITDKAKQEEVKQAIADDVKKAKQAIKDDIEKKKQELEAIPPAVRDAMNNVQLYKFYPKNKDIDLEGHNLKSAYINRYYGKAQHVL